MRELQRVPAGVWIRGERALVPGGRFVELRAADEQRPRHRTQRSGVGGINGERATERVESVAVLPHGNQHRAQLTPRAHGIGLQFERTPQARDRVRAQLAPGQVVGLGCIRDAELQVRARVTGIEIDRALEQHHRAVERFVALGPQVEYAFGERLIGAHHSSLQRRGAGRADDGPQELGKVADQPILDGEDLRHSAVDLDRPLGMSGCRVQQLRRDAHRVAGALEAAGQHPSRAELAAHPDPESVT